MDDSIIYGFYKLPMKINRLNQRIKEFEWEFWQQSFTNCPLAYDDNGNKLTVKPFYKQVDDLLVNEDEINRIADFLHFKWQSFNHYLFSIDNEDEIKLASKYRYHKQTLIDDKLISSAIDECQQIEEASGYRYGFETDKAIDVSNDYQNNLDSMLAMFGVAN